VADGVSVVSAAVVSGELILGLSSGQLIRAGFVQGSQGLQGPPGPKGDTGRPGADGNSLLHGAGIPLAEDGKAGDFYIDTTRSWLYGPKVALGWGSPVKLKADPASFKLPTGMKAEQGDALYPRVFAGAMAGGGGGGTVAVGGGAAGGGTLQTILNHGTPLAAGAPTFGPPPTSTPLTPAVWTTVAVDPDTGGDAFIADIFAEDANGALLVELAVMRDSTGRTGYSQVYEVRTGTPPVLSFQAINDPSNQLALQLYSATALTIIRGRVLYI